MKTFLFLVATLFLSVSPFFHSILAQTEKQDLTSTILQEDSLFWKAYNSCDEEGMEEFFTDDIEFYHDKAGLTLGLNDLVAGVKEKLCGNENFRLRREAVKGSIEVFPLSGSDVIYGAIISGEHVFYVLEKGKEARLDGLAKFTHLWILIDGTWKMSRVLSYDHGPAPSTSHRKAIKLAGNILDQFVGQYKAPQSGVLQVQRESDLLHLLIGNQKYVLHAQSDSTFFVEDRDLTFEFTKNQEGIISKVTVREHGNIVAEAGR